MSIKFVKKIIAVVIVPCAILTSSFSVKALTTCAWGYINTIQMPYTAGPNEGITTYSIYLNFDGTGFPPSQNRAGIIFPASILTGSAMPIHTSFLNALAGAQQHRLPVKVQSTKDNSNCNENINNYFVTFCSNESCN
jgi:hypothetical protein